MPGLPVRDDHEAVMAGRQADVLRAREIGDHNSADAAESGIVNQLLHLGRHAEAAQRGQARLVRQGHMLDDDVAAALVVG